MARSLKSRDRQAAVIQWVSRLAKRVPVVYRGLRRTLWSVNHVLPPRHVPGIPGRVHRNDLMFDGQSASDIEHYREVGATATGFMRAAMQMSGWRDQDVSSCLDFGCGHGRVLRVLTQVFPNARITACDLDPEAIAFCAAEFGATPVRSSIDISSVRLNTYDLIWMGSVLTHLDEPSGRELLGTLAAHLNPSGVLAFSTHGTHAREHISGFGAAPQAAHDAITRALDERGFAYLPYAHYASDDYGLAWHTEAFVGSMIAEMSGPRLTLNGYEPGGWVKTQDLWAFTRVE